MLTYQKTEQMRQNLLSSAVIWFEMGKELECWESLFFAEFLKDVLEEF